MKNVTWNIIRLWPI